MLILLGRGGEGDRVLFGRVWAMGWEKKEDCATEGCCWAMCDISEAVAQEKDGCTSWYV